MAILDFWNTRLNPITMLPREVDSLKEYRKKKNNSYTSKKLNIENDTNFVTAEYVVKTLGLSPKTIGIALRKIGIEKISYKYLNKTYYKLSDIEQIEVVKKSKCNPTEEYISTSELMDILSLTHNQMFRLANKNKWKKHRFSGNVVYYLKSQVLNKC